MSPARDHQVRDASAAPADDDNGPWPPIEDLRNKLIRRAGTILKSWRVCPRPACRRSRGCEARADGCQAPQRRSRPMTPAQDAAAMARVRRALEARAAELRASEPPVCHSAARASAKPKSRPASRNGLRVRPKAAAPE